MIEQLAAKAEALERAFGSVVVDGVTGVIVATEHFRLARRSQRCSHSTQLRLQNVTADIHAGVLRTAQNPRKYRSIDYCQRCHTVLDFQLEELL